MRLAVAALAVIGALATYLWFAGGSGEPTTDLTTPSLPAAGEADQPAASTPSLPAEDGETRTFVIGPGEATARFELDEELRGQPTRVVGTTTEVAGQVRFDLNDPASISLSEILVNARTFQTDSSNRDRAIRGPVVLNSASDEFELIVFRTTSVEGLPTLPAGETLRFVVTGNLTIKGTTRPVSFDVEATWADETIEGTARSTVNRTDFGIGIPSAPAVAYVSEEVWLSLEFVARQG